MKTPTKNNTTTMKAKIDPIMLLMAAAEVVNGKIEADLVLQAVNLQRPKILASDKKKNKRPPYRNDVEYSQSSNSRYYRKFEDNMTASKRIRTSPPTPAPSYTTSDNHWRNTSSKYKNNDHRSGTRVIIFFLFFDVTQHIDTRTYYI